MNASFELSSAGSLGGAEAFAETRREKTFFEEPLKVICALFVSIEWLASLIVRSSAVQFAHVLQPFSQLNSQCVLSESP